jgi:hypothetical protein
LGLRFHQAKEDNGGSLILEFAAGLRGATPGDVTRHGIDMSIEGRDPDETKRVIEAIVASLT